MHKQWLLPQIFQHMYKCEEKKKNRKNENHGVCNILFGNPIFAEIPI